MNEKNHVVTKRDIKGDNLYFWSGTAKYQIPCKMYPLASKKNKACFVSENTDNFTNQELLDAINEVDLLMGYCYSNSYNLLKSAKNKGLNLEYYSGWIFVGNDFPIHHAWLVYEHEDKCSIIDSFTIKLIRKVNEELKERMNNCVVDGSNWRKVSVEIMKRLEKENPLNSQRIVCGKVPSDIVYVGSPDTIDNARAIFNELSKAYPNHPSYQKEGQNLNGASKLQEEYYGLK